MQQPEYVNVGGTYIALRRMAGSEPGLVWLGGFRSDMKGTKAEALAQWAAGHGRAFLRFDYSGHGESGGRFVDGTISKWLAESLAVFGQFTTGRQVLVASSMGAWIALRMVEELHEQDEGGRVAGLILLAPAPDFTSELVEPALTRAARRALDKNGFFEERSAYSTEPDIYTKALIEDGRENRVLAGPIDTRCPVHVIQGLADPDVPHSHALRLVSLLPADDVTLSLVPDGDHRLSRPQDIAMIIGGVEEMLSRIG
ncbi:MAG: 2-hydroxymuconic semialdehyde hydrolase [Microvirga sp.]|jgi:pimeloyl-ACP methyl ester carboxylesterase|nr:2-hydroxymuconic semialdehyde hydrolase [Microvirga sp.]